MQPKKNPSMSSTPADKIFTTELRICSVYVKINKWTKPCDKKNHVIALYNSSCEWWINSVPLSETSDCILVSCGWIFNVSYWILCLEFLSEVQQ